MKPKRPMVTVVVDVENGCEACWEEFERRTGIDPTTLPSVTVDAFEIPANGLFRCRHEASESAPSIFVRVRKADWKENDQ